MEFGCHGFLAIFLAIQPLDHHDLGAIRFVSSSSSTQYEVCSLKGIRILAHFSVQPSLFDQTLDFTANQPRIDDLCFILFDSRYNMPKFGNVYKITFYEINCQFKFISFYVHE